MTWATLHPGNGHQQIWLLARVLAPVPSKLAWFYRRSMFLTGHFGHGWMGLIGIVNRGPRPVLLRDFHERLPGLSCR